MAIIARSVCPAGYWRWAIPERESPPRTLYEPPAAAGEGVTGAAAGGGAAGTGAGAGAGAGTGREIAPLRSPAPVVGAATGAAAVAPGAKTGGSNSTVYSRRLRPR